MHLALALVVIAQLPLFPERRLTQRELAQLERVERQLGEGLVAMLRGRGIDCAYDRGRSTWAELGWDGLFPKHAELLFDCDGFSFTATLLPADRGGREPRRHPDVLDLGHKPPPRPEQTTDFTIGVEATTVRQLEVLEPARAVRLESSRPGLEALFDRRAVLELLRRAPRMRASTLPSKPEPLVDRPALEAQIELAVERQFHLDWGERALRHRALALELPDSSRSNLARATGLPRSMLDDLAARNTREDDAGVSPVASPPGISDDQRAAAVVIAGDDETWGRQSVLYLLQRDEPGWQVTHRVPLDR